jgi:hypothetical protein
MCGLLRRLVLKMFLATTILHTWGPHDFKGCTGNAAEPR